MNANCLCYNTLQLTPEPQPTIFASGILTAEVANRAKELDRLQIKVIACDRCARLRDHCQRIAQIKRRAFLNWEYWAKPVPSFGDPDARLLIIGLAPGAHGANRTGRMFTGDGSGDFLYRVLFETGFASQPTATDRFDGLKLEDAYITAPVRCAPPANKPSRQEFEACQPYLERELELLENVRVIVTLGQLGFDAYLRILLARGDISRRSQFPFSHGMRHRFPAGLPTVFCSYHPSRQNTQTGRLTKQMLLDVFQRAKLYLSSSR